MPEALSVKFNQMVYEHKRRGDDIITLSLGEAFFSIPKFSFDNLDTERGYHYTDSQGLPELREAISKYYNLSFNCNINLDKNILISAGSKIIIYMSILASIDPGDEVILFEPAWLSYEHQINLASGQSKFIPFSEDIENIEEYFTNKTKLIIINNPNNPSGRVYKKNELLKLVETCRSNNITVLFDEAYSDFVDKDEFYSAANLFPNFDKVIVVNSLSKTMGMSGWRIGYIITNQIMIKKILRLNQHLITCAPSILQLYLAKHFKDINKITVPQAKEIKIKRDKVQKLIDASGLKTLSGSSTFYFFIDLRSYVKDTYFLAQYLLTNHHIAMVPGSAYGKSTAGFLRMSIGTENIERIQHALNTLKQVLSSNEKPWMLEKD